MSLKQEAGHTDQSMGFKAIFGLMDLCWLSAWGIFVFSLHAAFFIPLDVLIGAYVAAFSISALFNRFSYRIIYKVCIQTLALGALIYAGLSVNSLAAFPAAVPQWIYLFLTVAAVFFFWYKGTSLSGTPQSYQSACRYFDLGVAMFFTLYLIKLLVALKSSFRLDFGPIPLLMAAFLFLGLAGIFFSAQPFSKSGIFGSARGYGIQLFLAAAVITGCIGCVLYFNPVMVQAADRGYDLLKKTAGPLSPILVTVLKFIFAPRTATGRGGAAPEAFKTDTSFSADIPGSAGQIDVILQYLLGGIILTAAGCAAVFILYRLLRLLLEKKPGQNPEPFKFNLVFIISFPVKLIKWISALTVKITRRLSSAKDGFQALMKWGQRSGLPKLACETPKEYANRLGDHFIELKTEFENLSGLFQAEAYAQNKIDETKLKSVRQSLKQLKNPKFWWMRIKLRFLALTRPKSTVH